MMHRLFTLVSETHVHVGEGQAFAAVDQPVARESVSLLPFIAGHSQKGAIKSTVALRASDASLIAAGQVHELRDQIFGEGNTGAGALLVGDVRLLAIPLRASGVLFVWATSPFLLRRLARDLEFASRDTDAKKVNDLVQDLPPIASGSAILPDSVRAVHGFGFNLMPFEKRIETATALSRVAGLPDQMEFERNFAIFNDNDFKTLMEIALPVRARNKLDENKRSENLWYEETLPPDTIMTTLFGRRGKVDASTDIGIEWACPVDLVLAALETGASKRRYLQIGGNETVGQGVFQVFEGPRQAEGKGQ